MPTHLVSVIALLSSAASTDVPLSPEQVRETLQMAADAQLTREAQWKQGMMRVAIEQTGVNAMTADLTLAWEGDREYFEIHRLKQQGRGVSGDLHDEESHPYRVSLVPNTEWSYFPTLAAVYVWGPGKTRGIPSSINVRPAHVWGAYPSIPQNRLTGTMTAWQTYEGTRGTRLNDGLVRITGRVSAFFIDPAADGQLVRIESEVGDLAPKDYGIASPNIYIATYDWDRDPHGVAYCRKFRLEYFNEQPPSSPVYVREVTVSEFNSKLEDEWRRFDLDSLQVPKGTQVKYSDVKGHKAWRYGIRGSEAQGLQQPDFDRLINEAKKGKLASPD